MAKKRSLDPMREQLRVLTKKANKMATKLIEKNVASRALLEAQRTLKKMPTRADDSQLFRADLKRTCDINREFARVQAFLNDYTSTVRGAKGFTSDIKGLAGAFGSQWNVNGTGKNYDTERIDEDVAKKAFEIYRKVIEAAGGWERAVGMLKGKESLIGYGSENLIINIYDMVDNGMREVSIQSIALEMVENGIKAYEEMAAKQVADYDYGIVFDDETVTARRQFYTWRRKYRKGEI